jgi:hypothetical protein
MKNLFILLISLTLIVGVNAQIQTDPQSAETVDQTLGYGTDASYLYYTGQTADTLGAGDSVYTYTFRAKSKFPLKPEAYISVDSTGGTVATGTITLSSKTFAVNDYTIRETVSWVSGIDSVKKLESDSSHISEFWKLQISFPNDGFRVKIKEHVIKFTEDR